MGRAIVILILSFFAFAWTGYAHIGLGLDLTICAVIQLMATLGLVIGSMLLYMAGYENGYLDGFSTGCHEGKLFEQGKRAEEERRILNHTGFGKAVPLKLIPPGEWTVVNHQDAGNDLVALLQQGDNNALGEFRLVKATAGFDIEVLKACDVVEVRVEVDGGVRVRPAMRQRR